MNKQIFTKKFKQNIINTHGNKGKVWLDNLPSIIKQAEVTFGLSRITALTDLSFNYTTQATRQTNDRIIVKFCLPGDEAHNEIEALRHLSGDAMIKLLNCDQDNGILLLEQCLPGENLASLKDDIKATTVAAHIIKKLQTTQTAPGIFPTTQKWFNRLNQKIQLPDNFSTSHIDRAKSIAHDLHQQIHQPVLLHGDLHHFNILSAQRQPWLAIDPKGIIGPAEYECGAFLRNPIPDIAHQPNLKQLLNSRADCFSEILNIDKKIVIEWGYAQAVLASVWSIDAKSTDWQVFYKCSEALFELL